MGEEATAADAAIGVFFCAASRRKFRGLLCWKAAPASGLCTVTYAYRSRRFCRLALTIITKQSTLTRKTNEESAAMSPMVTLARAGAFEGAVCAARLFSANDEYVTLLASLDSASVSSKPVSATKCAANTASVESDVGSENARDRRAAARLATTLL